MIRSHVTHDRQTEAHPSGVPGASPVHPVEALENAVEMLRRDAHAAVRYRERHPAAVESRAEFDDAVHLGVLHRIVHQVPDSGHELPPVADHPQRRPIICHQQTDVTPLGQPANPVRSVLENPGGRELLAVGITTQFDPRELEKILDSEREALGLLHDLARQARHHVRVIGIGERLGEQRQCAHRRLQLMADIRHEVRPHCIEPGTFGDVRDGGDRPTRLGGLGVNEQHACWWAEQVERLTSFLALQSRLEQALNRLVHDDVTMACAGRMSGHAVAHHHKPVRVGVHHPDR